MNSPQIAKRLPPWFRIRIEAGERHSKIRSLIKAGRLHTVCESAACPNRMECWNAGTTTFMILGNVCTRSCRFCNVPKGIPEEADGNEPYRIADAVAALGLRYAVITSVTRDDLADGGASLFAETIRAIRAKSPGCKIEVLIPDFQGSAASLRTVLDSKPDILNHNLETVPSLYSRVRPGADYKRSMGLLAYACELGAVTKTGLMLGLGEGNEEVLRVMKELRNNGCTFLTLGQYLRPGKSSLPVEKYYHPDEFKQLRDMALDLGFRQVAAGPHVRSSYHAADYGSGLIHNKHI